MDLLLPLLRGADGEIAVVATLRPIERFGCFQTAITSCNWLSQRDHHPQPSTRIPPGVARLMEASTNVPGAAAGRPPAAAPRPPGDAQAYRDQLMGHGKGQMNLLAVRGRNRKASSGVAGSGCACRHARARPPAGAAVPLPC